MFVGSVSIGGTEDRIALAVVGNHGVLVATACLDGEFPGVVSVELGKWEDHDVELVGKGQFACCLDRCLVPQWVVYPVQRVLQSNLKMGEVWAW